jgi:hypothetical protein
MIKEKIMASTSKNKAMKLLKLYDLYGASRLELPSISVNQLNDYIRGKRKNIAIFEIDGEDLIEVKGSKSAAKLLKQMLEEMDVSEVVFPELPKEKLCDFIDGNSSSLITMEVVLND